MSPTFADAWNYLTEQSFSGLFSIFWYVLLFEIPRYALMIVAVGLAMASRKNALAFVGRSVVETKSTKNLKRQKWEGKTRPAVSVMVIGHSEGAVLEKCVMSLHEQTLENFEIVIASDGSTDNMVEVATDLVKRGLARRIISTDIRCGKSAAFNLCRRYSEGDILINVDCDSSFDRSALERVIQPILEDPNVGASSGNVIPRNGTTNLLTRFQVIEYLVSISVGRRTQEMFNQVTCLSGAFTAFRKRALEDVGDMDVGGGEDFDMTLRLRSNGWDVRFVADAECYTAVPTKPFVLIRQRLRWERDSVRIRFRKHKRLMNPFHQRFKWEETFHQWDYLFFSVISALLFPVYTIWMFSMYGEFALLMLAVTLLAFVIVDVIIFFNAIYITRQWHLISYFPFVLGYGFYSAYFMRSVRIWAYLQEWLLDASRKDKFVPTRVSQARKW